MIGDLALSYGKQTSVNSTMAVAGAPDQRNFTHTMNAEYIHNDLMNMVAGDSVATQSVVDLNMTLFNKLEALEIEHKNLLDSFRPIVDRLSHCEKELFFLKNENHLLQQKVALTEDISKTMYLRLEGLSEQYNNNLPQQVAICLSKTGVQCSTQDFDHVKRIGKYKEGGVRPIRVRFNKEGKRNTILYNRVNINKNKAREDPFLWLNDDVSDETRHNRKAVRDVAALAQTQGCKAIKVHGDGIIIDNNKYKHSDLDLLPPKLSLTKAKSRDESTGIYFQGKYSPFSNHYQSRFTDDLGQTFECVEQAFQHKKASSHGKFLIANKLLQTRNIEEIHSLAKQIPTKKAWLDEEEGIMEMLITAKFSQNDFLRKHLIRTGNKQLHEATKHPKWGTGAELASKALRTGDWSGQDLLGKILEKVRAELTANSPDSSSILADDSHAEINDEQEIDLQPMPDNDTDQIETNPTSAHTPSPLRQTPASSPKVQTPTTSEKHTPAGTSTSSPPISILNSNSSKKKRAAPPPPVKEPMIGPQRSSLRGNQAAKPQPRDGNRLTRARLAATSKGKS